MSVRISSIVIQDALKIKDDIKGLEELRTTYQGIAGWDVKVVERLNYEIECSGWDLVQLLNCLEDE